MRLIPLFATLLRNRKGATAVEYGLILALIVLAVLSGMKALATVTITTWNNVGSNMASVTPP